MSEAPQGFEPSIKQRIVGLDELRGMGVIAVLITHYFNLAQYSFFKTFSPGGIFVDLFFVISGFLIGKILLESRGEQDFFRRFYVRRIFRVLPLYCVVVLSAILIVAWMNPSHLRSAPFYLTFTQNWLYDVYRPTDNLVGESFRPIPGLGPLWSLAVEEQFYAIMPLMIAFCSKRYLIVLLGLLSIVGLGLDYQAAVPPEPVEGSAWYYWVYYSYSRLTHFKMHYLAMGVLLNFPSRWRYFLPIMAFGLGMIWWSDRWYLLLTWFVTLGMLIVMELALYRQICVRQGQVAWCGLLCFGSYVLHLPILLCFRPMWRSLGLPEWGHGLGFFPYFAICLTVAWLSFRYFEIPMQRLRRRYEKRAEVVSPVDREHS